MAVSLAIIIILGLPAKKLFEKMKLPGLLGMLIVGVIIGPSGLNLLEKDMLNISGDLRKIALIIILLRAGLGIQLEDLKKVGGTALRLSFIPCLIEGFLIAFISIKLLNFSFIQGGLLGFIIAAVSPAVVVPSMLELMHKNLGTKKGIPTLILAGVSVDDVVAITIFSGFLGSYGGAHMNITKQLFNIPLSIILGILLGVVVSFILLFIYKKFSMRDTKKVLFMLGFALLITEFKSLLHLKLEIASLLGVMVIGFIIIEKMPSVGTRLASKFNKIWVFAEIFLFVLVGAQVNINVAIKAGKVGAFIILIGLVGRSLGVLISVAGTNLNWKERIFCVIAYTPKATVQAAMGAVPLSFGVASGDVILAIAVLSILITAPLGAIGIHVSARRLLRNE